eukprot:445116_1
MCPQIRITIQKKHRGGGGGKVKLNIVPKKKSLVSPKPPFVFAFEYLYWAHLDLGDAIASFASESSKQKKKEVVKKENAKPVVDEMEANEEIRKYCRAVNMTGTRKTA